LFKAITRAPTHAHPLVSLVCYLLLFKTITRAATHAHPLVSQVCYRISPFILSHPDIPISYGLIDLKIDSQNLNCVEFTWDPQRGDTGVYIKVNCISTEFTPRKHGGEKGVPFRIQVETYSANANCGGQSQLVHCASCQVKVFKVYNPLASSVVQLVD